MRPGSCLLALLLGTPVAAQQSARPAAPQLVDRIVAVAGDSIVFESEIEDFLRQLESQGQSIPRSDTAELNKLKRQAVEERIERLVLLQAAQRDTTIKLNDAAINQQVENIVNQRRQQMGGQAAFDAALRQARMTFTEWRDALAQDVRAQALIQQYLQRVGRDRKPPPITEQKLKAEFEKAKAAGRLPARQATIVFSHIVLPPRASDEARAQARAKADSIFGLLRAGEDFVALAKRFSDEPGAAERGGDLGFARPEAYVKEFADAVSVMRPGDVVGPVETMFGFHIIRLEKIKGAERQVRHILIRPQSDAGDTERLLERGRQIAAQLRAGADVDSMAKSVGSLEARTQVEVARDRLPQISPAYAQNLATAGKGDVVGPFLLEDQSGNPSAAVVKVENVKEAGEPSWDDLAFRAVFRSQVEQQRLIEEVIEELRRRTHIEIRL